MWAPSEDEAFREAGLRSFTAAYITEGAVYERLLDDSSAV